MGLLNGLLERGTTIQLERAAPGGDKGQFTRVMAVVAATALVAVNVIWLFPSLRDVRSNAARLRLEIAGRAADSVNNFIEQRAAALQNGADELRAHDIHSGQARWTLERLLKENTAFNAISLIDAETRKYIRASRFEVFLSADLDSDIPLLALKGIPGGKVYYSAVFKGEHLEPLLTMAVPVTSTPGLRHAVLIAELNLQQLSESIERFRFGYSGKVYVADASGNLIADPDLSLVLHSANLYNRPVIQRVLSERAVLESVRYVNERGVSVEASGLFFDQLHWAVVSEQDVAGVNILRNRIIVLAALSFGVGLILLALLLANSAKLARSNARFGELLSENHLSAKMLVQRDLELTRANARLEELDVIKSEFVSVAAHQLRTPLAGIRWSLVALAEEESGTLNPEQSKIVSNALKVTVHMVELINALLSVARIEEGRFGFDFALVAFPPLLEQAVQRFQEAARGKGIQLTFRLPKTPLPPLSLDAEKIAIVVDNLIDNAIKYTPPGGSVTIAATKEKTTVRLVVQDTGIGIPKDQLHRIFNKFFRADNALLFQTSGNGLGLYVVENIVKRHHGTITVESVEGGGTTFSLTFPLVDDDKARQMPMIRVQRPSA
ncbi:MAG: sensor histidine kinase [Patescibacteria group bacterium]|nr:sensor histidine kinase [Patescibacteria group bacterium]